MKKKYIKNLFIGKWPDKKNYSIVPQELQKRDGIDFDVKGLYTEFFMVAQNWNVNISYLMKKSGRSEKLVRKLINELERIGYLHRIVLRDRDTQKIIEWGYYVPIKFESDKEVDDFLSKNTEGWAKINRKKDFLDDKEPENIEKKIRKKIEPTCRKTHLVENRLSGSETPHIIIEENNYQKDDKQIKPKGLIKQNQTRKKINEQSEKEMLALKLAESEKLAKMIAKLKKNKPFWAIYDKYYPNVKPEISKGKHFTELKSFQNSVKLLRKAVNGTLFNSLSPDDPIFEGTDIYKTKFPLEEILKCINIHIKALSSEYEPVDKEHLKMHLDAFLLNPRKNVKSYLIHWMLNDPKPVIPLEEVKDEQLFNSLLEELNWENKSNKDKNKVISFINKNHDFLSKLKQNAIKNDNNYKAKAIIEGINKSFLKEITPSLFVNPKLMDWIEEHIINSSWIV
jgi:hypothetical protein